MNRQFNSGFTLVELMIVVTVIGVMGSIAVGAYTGYTKEADRRRAQADLYEIAQVMEREFTNVRSYAGVTVTTIRDLVANDFYTIAYDGVSPLTPTTYQVNAIATNSRDDNDLAINQFGTEIHKKNGAGAWIFDGWDNIPD